MGDANVFQRVADDEEAFLKVSPLLVLRGAPSDGRSKSWRPPPIRSSERANQSIAVFDTENVVGLLSRPGVLEYLAGMLASFTRTESYVVPVRVRPRHSPTGALQ